MLKIGIIGAGRIGKVHLESISYHVKGAEVVAIADPFMNDETKAFCEGFGVEKIYTDYTKIIEDKDIDAVLVCSSTDTHAPISIEAINAGKHVFCEKPLANTVDKILEIAEALPIIVVNISGSILNILSNAGNLFISSIYLDEKLKLIRQGGVLFEDIEKEWNI